MAWNSRRLILWTSGLILAPLLLALIAFAILIWGIDPDMFRGRIERAASQTLGRSVRLDGGLHWRPGLHIQIENRGGEIAAAPGFGPAPFASWRALRFGLSARPLLRKQIHIDGIEIDGLQLQLERAADGAVNWQFQPAAPQAGTTGNDLRLQVGALTLRDGSIRFRDAQAGRDFSITQLRVDAKLPEDFTAGSLRFADFDLQARIAGAPVDVSGASLVLSAPQIQFDKVTAQFSVPDWQLKWNDTTLSGGVQGQGGDAPVAQGQLRLETPSLRQLLASVSVAAPLTRDTAALGRLQLAARLSVKGNSAELEELDATLDATHLAGRVQLPALSPLSLRFELTADKVDVDRYLEPENVQSEPFELPLAALKNLNAKGVLRITQATMAGAVARELTIDVD